MKPLRTTLAAFALFIMAALFAGNAHAYNLESVTTLERYTILNNNSVEYASGYLRKDGTLNVQLSYILSPIFYNSPQDFALISGRPIMLAGMFDAYKMNGLLPNWVRSKQTYSIGFADYVIVSTKSGPDPNPLPTIIEQPGDDRVLAGNTAFFFTDAEPWLYVTFQWYFKNKPIPGATSDWLMITNVSKAQAGFYHVAVSAGGKPVLSRKAKLTIVDPVRIKTHPKPQTITAGKNINLRVAATGTKPLAYQWYRDGQVITNATKTVLVIPRAQATNSGTYYVSVNNGVSWAWSSNAVVAVAAP